MSSFGDKIGFVCEKYISLSVNPVQNVSALP